LTPTPDLEPLLGTLRRLRDDITMIARTAVLPLPETFQVQLEPALFRINDAAAGYLCASGAALVARKPPPVRQQVDAALDGYATEITALRHLDTEEVTVDALKRVFTLGLALEQLRRNSKDLERCVAEHCEKSRASVGSTAGMRACDRSSQAPPIQQMDDDRY
jgi:hypothetical protein